MVNKIIFTIIGLFFIVMFFVIINKLNKNKETKKKHYIIFLALDFFHFYCCFYSFKKIYQVE